MKDAEDEAFDELARRQGMWGGGFPAKRRMAADKLHWSDCAVHNGPAYPAGPCDCDARLSKYAETLLEEATRSCNNIDEQRALDALMLNFHKPAQEPDDLRLHQWTANEKDLSDYICVGSLTLAGIDDGEYGQSEIDSLENTIEALQERLVTGSEHKKVPLLAYIGGLNTTPPAPPQRPWVGLTTDEMKAVADRYHLKPPNIPAAFRAIEAKLKERNHGT